ncbi:hypothetical protein [Paenibacillus luteus]|uniref:hypothetical protein n=1 Tax=Paenibacillus luteus TaxID=2545753 RepID=UPI001144F117|nr:hypothetical protein [Paenibacillus luteus]
MTTSERSSKKEQEQTEAAWARLQTRLQEVEPSPLWEQWEAEGAARWSARGNADEPALGSKASTTTQGHALLPVPALDQGNAVPLGRVRSMPSESACKPAQRGAARRWMKKNMGKTIAVCAAVFLTVVIATPSTNQALAAWLNTFRMDKVMVVQENDLVTLMNSFMNDGETLELSNRFGDFEQTAHGQWNRITPEGAAKALGFDIPSIKVADNQVVYISSSATQTFTFRLKVNEINRTMSKLGADKLLPLSVDGKKINFDTGKQTQISYQTAGTDANSLRRGVMVNYMEVPTVNVDPSVEVKDAFDAVIRFPALPDHIRTSLLQASSLEDGEIPMPLITRGHPEKVAIKGIDVYVERQDDQYAAATWLEHGYVVTANFSNYGNEANVKSVIAELIRS